jgi:hypothetical protein
MRRLSLRAKFGGTQRRVESNTAQTRARRRYLPWADEDVHEDFTNGMFTDSVGHLKLSASQIKAPFKRWQRASELTEFPKMIDKITPQSIRQTVSIECTAVFFVFLFVSYVGAMSDSCVQ